MDKVKVILGKYLKQKKGFTLVELITAMAIMSILTVAYFSLFFAGSETYDVVYDGYKVQNEARIAVSFITVKIRQNDRVVTDPATGDEHNSVTIQGPFGARYMRIEGPTTEYIYAHDTSTGRSLMITDDLTQLFTDSGRVIAEGLTDISMEYPDPAITDQIIVKITYNSNGPKQLEETIILRSET